MLHQLPGSKACEPGATLERRVEYALMTARKAVEEKARQGAAFDASDATEGATPAA